MVLSRLSAFFSYKKAKNLRGRGEYNSKTLKLFFKAWYLTDDQNYLIEYIKFRRDLGQPISLQLSKEVLKVWAEISPKNQALIFALLLEANDKRSQKLTLEALKFKQRDLLIPATLTLQAVSTLSHRQQLLLRIYTEQTSWRAALAEVLQTFVRGLGIHIIGNAGLMLGSGLGAKIDSAGFVVRFNAFEAAPHLQKDLGSAYHAWCVTPSFKAECASNLSWLLVAGPEMQYRLADWSYFLPFREKNIPIITLPLEVWRGLVKELQAPPSAGICLLAFFYALLGSWSGIYVAGFGALSDKITDYHYMNPRNKASQRHNWVGEERLIKRWLVEGLTSLHT